MRRLAAVAAMALLLAACAPDLTPPPVPAAAPDSTPPPPPPGSSDFANGEFHRPLSPSDAEQILLRTELFAFGGMNDFPHQEAVAVLARQPDAVQIARRISRDAGPAGRLFAFCLFKILEDQNVRRGEIAGPRWGEVESLAVELAQSTTLILFVESDTADEVTVSASLVRILNRRLWLGILDEGRRRLGTKKSTPPSAFGPFPDVPSGV